MAGSKYVPALKNLKCVNGTVSTPLTLMVDHGVYSGPDKQPLANVNDYIPMVNIMPFGMCTLIKEAPIPCVPVTAAPWMPGDIKFKIGGAATLTYDSKLVCCLGGMISIQK